MLDRWTHSNKATFNLGYHLIWCPKYRRPILKGDIELKLKELIQIKCDSINVNLIEIEIMPDHVHLFVKSEPTASPHWIVQQIKGYTSRIMRDEFKELKSKLPTLWTRSYFCESVGHISEDTVKKYIQEQKDK